jgi:hypothetical protein
MPKDTRLEHGPELMTVDRLGDDRRPVANQVGDRFDGGLSLSLMMMIVACRDHMIPSWLGLADE